MLAAAQVELGSRSERVVVKRAVLAALDGLRLASGGYLEALDEYDGEFNEEIQAVIGVLSGRAPAVLVSVGDDSADMKSMDRRKMVSALDLEIFVVSAHLRSREARMTGDEAGVLGTGDPGIDVMLADVRDRLAGADLGIPGVERPILRGATRLISDPRLAMFRQSYSVRCAVVATPPVASPVRALLSVEHRENLEDSAGVNPITAGEITNE